MNSFPSRNGNVNIHEPLEVADPKHPEEIFDRDILKRSKLAERILSRLREEDCPRALGIYGGWGTGKTSLLKSLNGYADNRFALSRPYSANTRALETPSSSSSLTASAG